MKKIAISAIILVSAVILSGCSLAPTASKTSAPVANPNNSIWASFDSGKTWLNNFLPNGKVDISGVDVLSMAINHLDAKNVFVGTRGGGILKTDNGGDNWEYLNFQPEKVYGLDIDPRDGKTIYASGVWQKRGKIYKSTDAGVKWEEIYTAAANGPLVISLIIDKKNPNTVYATTSDNQIIKTTDGGISWGNIFTATSPVLDVVIDSGNSSLIYAIAQNGDLLRSRDAGKKFEDLSRRTGSDSKINVNFDLIEADPANSSWLYAAGQGGLFRSKDAGDNWEKIEILNIPQTFPVKALAINPINSREIVYGAAQTTYRSLDGGSNWETFQFNVSKTVRVIKYAPSDSTNLYLGFSK